MHFVIIGNGVAGITAAFAMRERDASAAITVVSGESDYFFARTALMYVYMDRMQPRDLEPHERAVYEKKRIRCVRAWVRDIDSEHKHIVLDSGEAIAYDKLLIATGSAPNRFPWPGLDSARDGVVQFVSMQDLERCERLTPSTKRAVVVGGGLIGIELVECLAHHGVHVTFLVRDQWYWPIALGSQEGEMVAAHIRKHGVDICLEEEVASVESNADARVRSIRTNRNRELPCEMLGVAIGVRPAIDWLRAIATPLALGRGILASRDFRTSLGDIFVAGDCAEIEGVGVEQIWYSAKRQGELAAQSMLGDKVHYTPPIFFNSAKMFEIEYTTVGRMADGAGSFYYRQPGRDVSIRIAAEGGAVVGFNMLGSRWDHRKLSAWIEARRTPAEAMASLHQAQFDIEFGRFDLAAARSAFK
jgi:NAD(P)H-nitrite reductase large subunit